MSTLVDYGAVPGWARRLLDGRDAADAWPAPERVREGWQPGTVSEVIVETPDTVTLRLAVPDRRAFLPGQHFHVEVPTGGPYPAVETYSAASSPWPDPDTIDLTIKEVPGGRISPVLVRRVPVGAVLAVEGPLGYLTWDEADGGPLVLVGAGSGISPLMAMIRYASARDLDHPGAPALLEPGARLCHLRAGTGPSGRRTPVAPGRSHLHRRSRRPGRLLPSSDRP